MYIKLRIIYLFTEGLKRGEPENPIFSNLDILHIAQQDRSQQIQNAAILACSHVLSDLERRRCVTAFRGMLGCPNKLTQCYAAIALLRLTNWIDRLGHLKLQQMIHDESVSVLSVCFTMLTVIRTSQFDVSRCN